MPVGLVSPVSGTCVGGAPPDEWLLGTHEDTLAAVGDEHVSVWIKSKARWRIEHACGYGRGVARAQWENTRSARAVESDLRGFG